MFSQIPRPRQIGRQGTSTAALQSRLKALQQEVHRWKGRAKQQDAEACALRQKLKEMEAAKGHTGAPATATETATEGAKDHVSGQKIEKLGEDVAECCFLLVRSV